MLELEDVGDVLFVAELEVLGLLCEFARVLAFGLEQRQLLAFVRVALELELHVAEYQRKEEEKGK